MKRPSCYIIAAMAVQSLAYALTSEDSGKESRPFIGVHRGRTGGIDPQNVKWKGH